MEGKIWKTRKTERASLSNTGEQNDLHTLRINMFSLRPHSNNWLPLSLLEVHPLCRPHVLVVNAFVAPIPPFASRQTGKYSFPAKLREAAENGFRFLISRPLKITKRSKFSGW